jgi:hypothetical protein
VCQKSPSACAVLSAGDAEFSERVAREEQQRRNWEAAFRNGVQFQAGSSVNVNYYEGGRLQTKTISSERYQQLYGSGN